MIPLEEKGGMYMDLIKIDYTNNSVNARDVYYYLFGKDGGTDFSTWIGRTIARFGFIENKDFTTFLGKSSGGRKPIDYAVTLDMAKELAMITPNEKGKKVRRYFLKCEKILRKEYAERIAAKEARKTLTDSIQESGENERMHGFAYSTYTRYIYKILDIEYKKDKDFRDKLNPDQLKNIQKLESLIKSYIDIGLEYQEIKKLLPDVIQGKIN
jgi:phage anti-repressor protein